MIYNIFYSWQSDLPNKSNRSFIEYCIKKAIKMNKLSSDIKVYIDYDRDTLGVSGSPDISETIFNKIDRTDIFICDISIINQDSKGRKTPNPNVLVELGYAAKVLGWERIIILFNKKFGNEFDLPFDLNHKRILFYNSDIENEKDRVSNIISQSIFDMYSSGILYNPLKDHIKGKIDYCMLEILKHISSIIYGTLSMSESLGMVTELLGTDKNDLKLKFTERKNILGFFAHKNLNDVRDKLENVFSTINSSNNYPVDWAVTVLNLNDWIRSFQWHISSRREDPLFIKRLSPNTNFDIIPAGKMNPANRTDSYILLKKVGKDSGEVINTATMSGVEKKYVLSPYSINLNAIDRFIDCVWKVVEISNNWLDSNGSEFILDPEFYHIGGPI